jgi:hypothetical protein
MHALEEAVPECTEEVQEAIPATCSSKACQQLVKHVSS